MKKGVKIPRKFKNKYVLVSLLFIIQLTFFESVDLITLYKQKKRQAELRKEVQQMKEKTETMRDRYNALHDPLERERFAREVHNFKRDNEVIFVLSNK